MRNSLKHVSLVGLLLATTSLAVFAEDKPTAAQLETTPPAADGALTPDQTPPFTMPSATDTSPASDSIGKTASTDTSDNTATEEELIN